MGLTGQPASLLSMLQASERLSEKTKDKQTKTDQEEAAWWLRGKGVCFSLLRGDSGDISVDFNFQLPQRY